MVAYYALRWSLHFNDFHQFLYITNGYWNKCLAKGCTQKFTSNTSREDSFPCRCLKPFTFEVVCDMCHLISERVYTSQNSFFFFFYDVRLKLKQFPCSHWQCWPHSCWIRWASLGTNTNPAVEPSKQSQPWFRCTFGIQDHTQKKQHIQREEGGWVLPKLRAKGKTFSLLKGNF